MKRKFAILALVGVAALAASADVGFGDACQPCEGGAPDDPKMHGRSLKSYWGVASKSKPPDPEVLAKAFDQGHQALCGAPDEWEWNMFMGMVSAEREDLSLAGCYFAQAMKHVERDKDREKIQNNRDHYWVEHYNEALNFFKQEAWEFALEEVDMAIAVDSTNCKAYAVKGPALINLKRHGEAVAALEEGIALCPEDEALQTNLFGGLHNQGNECFNQAAEASDDSTRLAHLAQAMVWYEKAFELDPEHVANLYQLGTVHLQLAAAGDTTHIAAARDVLDRFLAVAESKEDRLAGLYQLTLVEIEAEDWAKASEHADEYIAADPRDADGYRLKANISVNSGQAELAEGFIIFSRAQSEGAPVEDVSGWLKQMKYVAGSDLGKIVKEKGDPEAVLSYTDSAGNNMDAVFYWSKGEGYAFYSGQKRGSVRFPAVTP